MRIDRRSVGHQRIAADDCRTAEASRLALAASRFHSPNTELDDES